MVPNIIIVFLSPYQSAPINPSVISTPSSVSCVISNALISFSAYLRMVIRNIRPIVSKYPRTYCSATGLIFAALAQTMTGSLQGLGKVYVPAISLLFGCIAKIVLNIVLIRIPSINIYGAAISSIACQFISCAICFVVLANNHLVAL